MSDCLSCIHAGQAVDPATGRIDFQRKICRESPPVPVVVPTATGAAVQAMFPVVGKGTYCGKHEAIPGTGVFDGDIADFLLTKAKGLLAAVNAPGTSENLDAVVSAFKEIAS